MYWAEANTLSSENHMRLLCFLPRRGVPDQTVALPRRAARHRQVRKRLVPDLLRGRMETGALAAPHRLPFRQDRHLNADVIFCRPLFFCFFSTGDSGRSHAKQVPRLAVGEPRNAWNLKQQRCIKLWAQLRKVGKKKSGRQMWSHSWLVLKLCAALFLEGYQTFTIVFSQYIIKCFIFSVFFFSFHPLSSFVLFFSWLHLKTSFDCVWLFHLSRSSDLSLRVHWGVSSESAPQLSLWRRETWFPRQLLPPQNTRQQASACCGLNFNESQTNVCNFDWIDECVLQTSARSNSTAGYFEEFSFATSTMDGPLWRAKRPTSAAEWDSVRKVFGFSAYLCMSLVLISLLQRPFLWPPRQGASPKAPGPSGRAAPSRPLPRPFLSSQILHDCRRTALRSGNMF